MIPGADVVAYPWQSDTVYAAEVDDDGVILRANPALLGAAGGGAGGRLCLQDLLSGEQRAAFARSLADAGERWRRAIFGFLIDGGAEDRTVWLRREPGRSIELVAEPAWTERDRLVGQVLALNDDLIATQRTLARRQRDLERAQDEAAHAARRVRQLEAILLAAITPREVDGALRSLLAIAQELLPGERADILLVDETTDRLVLRASAGEAASAGAATADAAVLASVATAGTSILIDDLAPVDGATGSLIAVPLRLEGEIIGVLSVSAHRTGSFSEPDRRLLEVVGERVALAIGQVQLRDREQRLAETVQRTLLPQTLPDLPGVTLRARYLPHSAGVGGDFYDAIRLPGGRVGVAIGDITGKGLRAAATMGRLRSALHAYALDASRPADVLNRLGRFAQVDGAMATALYLVLDPATGWMELASAGHLPPLGIGAGETAFIDVRAALSPPLGWAAERHAQLRLRLPPGRGLLLYTDGLVELTHNLDEGMRRLAGAADAAPAGSLDAFCDHLLGVVAGDDRYHDDVAMLVLRRDD